MITCPKCAHSEMEGAFFCSQCGAELFSSGGMPTSNIAQIREEPSTLTEHVESAPLKKHTHPIHQLVLRFDHEEKTIPIEIGMEIILGRISPRQSILPDIDLTPYGAYEAGVSRIHAKLCISQNEISLVDLGSANGTRVNGKTVPSRTAYRLNHDDEVSLGKLKFHILFM